MIQDIDPHHFDNTFIETCIRENDYIFHFNGNAILLKTIGEQLDIPRFKDLPQLNIKATFLFSLDHTNCFLIWGEVEFNNNDLTYHEIRSSQTIFQKHIEWSATVAFQLRNWYEQNRYCGKCGAATKQSLSERAINCESCQTSLYPNISPAIIVAILCGDKILLARGVNFREDFYSLVAGYVEVGESIEDAVTREVKEEVGIDIYNIRYYKSQPWPYSGSMMIGFIAEADAQQVIQIDRNEIIEAAWYQRNHLPNYPSERSIAGEMINKFINGNL